MQQKALEHFAVNGWAMSKRKTTMERFVRIFCAMLMLSLGFAHKPVDAAITAPVLDESYRLPDGTFAEICFGHAEGEASATDAGHGDTSGHLDISGKLFCEACLLASSILLPLPDGETWLVTSFVWLDNRPATERVLADTTIAERSRARAPPFFI
jgi:hypothetical protein